MNLALFDFDGTVTKKDSLFYFLIHFIGGPRYLYGLITLSPYLLFWKFGVISSQTAKEKLYKYYFGGVRKDILYKSGLEFLPKLERLINERALKRLNEHQENGDHVVIVTAASEPWLKAWCQKHKLALICTELVITNDCFTGEIKGNNCNGLEKVFRIKKELNLDLFDRIYAYGNSSGDLSMLELADEKFYKFF